MTAMTDEELWTVYKQAALSGYCARVYEVATSIDKQTSNVADDALIAHRERWPSGQDKD